jgi:hypothetical protein
MQLYGHVARFPVSDPAGRILSAREHASRTRPVGRPYETWLRQMDPWSRDGPCGSLKDGHQETVGVPLAGRCGKALLRRMLPLTD